MKKRATLYLGIMSIILLSTNSFAMMLENELENNSALHNILYIKSNSNGRSDFSKNEEINYDDKLTYIKGKNISPFPLSEEMYNFIISKVGKENKKPFIFKVGPQIIFEDDIDLLK